MKGFNFFNNLLFCTIIGAVLLLITFAQLVHMPKSNMSGLAAIKIIPSANEVRQGAELQVDINAKNAVNIGGAQFTVSYNPNILKFINVAEGEFLQSNRAETTMITNALDTSTPGQVKNIVVVRFGNGASGSGTIATLYFEAIESGRSDLQISDMLLSDGTGQPMTMQVVNTAVRVR